MHYIIDPTEKDNLSESPRKRFWKIKPFFEYKGDYSIDSTLATLISSSKKAKGVQKGKRGSTLNLIIRGEKEFNVVSRNL